MRRLTKTWGCLTGDRFVQKRRLREDSERNGRGGWRVIPGHERALEPPDAVPLAVLEPDVAKDPNPREAEAPVETFARRVRQRDAGVGVAKALQDENAKERLVQTASDTTSLRSLVDVRRDFDGPLIGGSRSVRPRVSVSDHVAIVFGYEPGIRPRQATIRLPIPVAAGGPGPEHVRRSLHPRR